MRFIMALLLIVFILLYSTKGKMSIKMSVSKMTKMVKNIELSNEMSKIIDERIEEQKTGTK